MQQSLTSERLREVLDYDPETGIFVWRISMGAAKVGSVAGCRRTTHGYIAIRIDGTLYLAHRLAIMHVEGHMPNDLVDHRDAVRGNNRYENLRVANQSINSQNRRGANAGSNTGLLGSYLNKVTGKFYSHICEPGRKARHIGTFDTAEEAHAAYVAAKRIHHEGCTI